MFAGGHRYGDYQATSPGTVLEGGTLAVVIGTVVLGTLVAGLIGWALHPRFATNRRMASVEGPK